MAEFFDALEDQDILFNFMVLINFVNQQVIDEAGERTDEVLLRQESETNSIETPGGTAELKHKMPVFSHELQEEMIEIL